MDHAEQSPRVPSRGSFDTASLLAPSTTIFNTQTSSVRSPLPHLTHSPSAFCVLGRNAVLVPPPLPPSSSNSDVTPPSNSSGKMCPPIIHQSASDALSSLASSSSSGACAWWPPPTSVVTTADFTGCGVTTIGDPFSRTAAICGRSLVSSPHLSLPQPRRIVEEVLGHLYAKPPSAESKTETQSSGLRDSSQVACTTTSVVESDLQNSQNHNSICIISKNEVKSGEKCETSVINNTTSSLPAVLSVPVISSSPIKAKKLDVNKNSNSVVSNISKTTSRRKKIQKDPNAVDSMKNGKKVKSNSRHKPQANKKPKEKSVKSLSSDSESHGESTSSSSGADSSSGGATASSGSSDSTDEEERAKQQQELARLKKQQKELRRKVQELKQASHESNQQKVEAQVKKVPTPKSSPRAVNHSKKPVPSPAHSSSTMAISPKSFPQKQKLNISTDDDDDANMSVPLDLCVKKQEPTFEVTSSSIVSSPHVTMANMAKKQLQAIAFNQQTSGKLQSSGPKKRGRKPKALTSASNILPPEMTHQLKQNSVKDFNSVGLPQKLLLPTTNNARNLDANSPKKNVNSISPSKSVLLVSGELSNSVTTPRKNFTLDSLLGESNGTLDFTSSPNSIDFAALTHASKNLKNKERMRYSNRIKRIEEKNIEFDLSVNHDSSSASDSDPDNDNSDSDESILGNNSTSAGKKRSCDEDGEDFSSKKRRVIPDEREVQIPLEHGWRRETKIRCFSRSGVRGEVTYYTPCGKKLRSYPEVIRYLLKNGIADISRDNFTFSTKVLVGEFLECTSSESSEGYVHLNEHEVAARINELRARKGRIASILNRKSVHPKLPDQEEQQRLWEQKQIQHQLEQQEVYRQAREAKMMRQHQKERALIAARNERKLKAEEARRQKEQQRVLKQQERLERLEQLRIEREIRAQQLLEEQEMKRQQAAFLREQEMQKRREMLLMVDLERERRRQHMILVRALETRKKQEERERKREEMLYEKRINKEKKMEQRRIELDYLRELKKPVEDMMLKDNAPLPTLNRIPGLKLPGKSFSDILMVFEFLNNFGETLGFDPDSLPALNTLQMAVLNLDEKLEEELLSVLHHLLVCAIDDPGVPHSAESATVLGQSLKDADITNSNVSEVLRLYFIAQDKRNIMCQWLHAKPFLALNASQKTEILAHICNDLLGSRVLMRKIDSNIENVNVLRKDKWLIEGDLRRLKTVQQRRLLKARQLTYEESKLGVPGNNSSPTEASGVCSLNNSNKDDQNVTDPNMKNSSQCDKDKLDDLDNDNESGNDSDDTQAHGIVSDGDDEDLQLSNEELTKKVDKLSKQHTCYSNKLTKALHTIRGCTFGQDRYHRRYWVLPKAGGIFVESLESSELPERQELILAQQDVEESSEKMFVNDDAVEDKKESDDSVELKACEDNVKENESINLDIKASSEETLLESETPMDITVEKVAEEAIDENSIKTEPESMEVEEKLCFENGVIEEICREEVEIKTEDVKEISTSEIKKEAEEDNLTPMDTLVEESSKVLSSYCEMDQKANIELEKSSEKKKAKERNLKSSEKNLLNEALDKKPDVNIFMPKFCDNLGLESCPSLNHSLHNSSERKPPPNPSIPGNQNWILHSPFFASLLAGNMLFNGPSIPGRETNGTYFNLPKSDSNNPFGPFLGIGQSALLSPEQVFKSLADKSSNQKPWFSILPRMPCDEDSLPKSHCTKNPFSSSLMIPPPNLFVAGTANSSNSKSPSHSAHSTTPVTSTAGQGSGQLSNLQMEILNGMPPGFFLHPFLPHQFGPTYQSGLPVNNNTSPNPFSPNLSHSGTIGDFTLNLGRPPASSTPSSIPTPSATPGPSSQSCGTPTYRDSPSPSFAKRFMMEKLTQEYDKPKPIPSELQKGWWRITDPSQLKDIVNALHHRGIREKMLQKQLQKHFNYASLSCTQGPEKDTDLEITDLDRKISELPGGVPLTNKPDDWSRDVALRLDLAVLEQIENLEEKIDGASMQIKGWKPPPKLSVEALSQFVPACELYLQVKCDINDSPRERCPKKSSKKSSRKKKAEARKRLLEAEAALEKSEETFTEPKLEDPEGDDKQELAMSENIKENSDEKADEKNGASSEENKGNINDVPVLPPGKINPVEEAKNRLLMVEAAIERRYLKPPLGFSSNDLQRSVSGGSREIYDNGEDEPIPIGLHKWRNSVNLCRSSAQLAMCLNYLENYTAWDKSIMRASCQFCHSGENEEMLLLCDGCDKGYHTYCFKPKMEKIPDGDWYCYECLNKATGDNVCVICGKKGKLIECSSCPKCFHIGCLEPPLSKIPKGKWFCSGCSHTRPKKSSKKSSSTSKDREKDKEKEKEPKESSSCKKSETSQSSKPKTVDRKDKKEKSRSQPNEDFAPCLAIVEEMEKHDDSWPFLSPVNTKQFPTYRKVIKKPMDLTTVRSKLESNVYKAREDFAADVRLIFDNCETFNEDDSPVGQAGHTMRAFFDTRWTELCST